jgi:heme/copper-type cytochrome/quinol oxidase subunit 2
MAPAPGRTGGVSFFGLFLTLCMLALAGWIVYFVWRRMRRAREAKKPNYSFERN